MTSLVHRPLCSSLELNVEEPVKGFTYLQSPPCGISERYSLSVTLITRPRSQDTKPRRPFPPIVLTVMAHME